LLSGKDKTLNIIGRCGFAAPVQSSAANFLRRAKRSQWCDRVTNPD
jgi:hypothetical protein